MAQEKARPTRARTTKKAPADKPAPKTATRKRASRTASAPRHDAIAAEAYRMWERGEPGDAVTHWLRAEQELAA
jgi:hypothetical protein